MMLYHNDTASFSTTKRAHVQLVPRSRKPSVTAIPRPISGTSRRASSRLVYTVNRKTLTQDKNDGAISPKPIHQSAQSPQPAQEHSATRSSMPPISYPRSMLPRSDSLMPYRDRNEVDLSGVQEQLHLTAYTNRPVEIQEDSKPSSSRTDPIIAETRKGKLRSSMPHATEITPRSLIKPIQPSIPRSSTTGQLTCFSGVHNASPSKPSRKESIGPVQSCKETGKLDIIDALLESRMSRHEIEMLDQVRNEVLRSEKRLSNSTSRLSSKSVLPTSSTYISARPTLGSPISLNLSVNDEINPQRLEKQHRGSTARRPLFINTALANTLRMYEPSSLSYPTPDSDGTGLTVLSSASSLDIRSVLCAKGNAYWTGRYVATTDRLRKSDSDALLKPQGSDQDRPNINSAEFEDRFDALDDTRMDRVLQELKGHCKTESALASFAEFEKQLRKKVFDPSQTITRSCSEVFPKQDRISEQTEDSHEKAEGVRKNLDRQSKVQPHILSTQAAIAKLSGIGNRRSSLVKSKTTGTLAPISTTQRPLTPRVPSIPNVSIIEEARIQFRNTTYSEAESKLRTKLMREQKLKTTGTKHISNEKTGGVNRRSSIDLVTNNATGDDEPRSFTKLHSCSSFQADVHGARSTGASSTSQATVIPLKSDASSASMPSSSQTTKSDQISGQDIRETVVSLKKSGSRKTSGPRSGDFVKKVMGASIREVRKMGRRVGSMGWGGNVDGLSTSASAKM